MPAGDLTTDVTPGPRSWGGWGSAAAALVALGLGVLAAVMMVAGHQPWDGPEVLGLSETHGIHQGDALAVLPLLAGIGLATWCLTRPSWKAVHLVLEAAQEQFSDPDRRSGPRNGHD